jgi:hypothetical protein
MSSKQLNRALNASMALLRDAGRAGSLGLAIALGTFGLAMTIASGAANAQDAGQRMGPCMQIRAACEQAGFVQGGARGGTGLYVDCVRPIMLGLQQPPRASIPLPAIDPQLVAACQARNPNFAGAMGPGGPVGPATAARPSMRPGPGPSSGPSPGPNPGRDPAPGEPTEPEQPPGSDRPSTPPSPQQPQAGNPAAQSLQGPGTPSGHRNIVVVLTADLASGAVSCRSPRP